MRLMLGERPMRLTRRASSEGAAMPVTDVTKIALRSRGSKSGGDQSAAQGLFTELEAHFDPDVVRLAPGLHILVEIDRTDRKRPSTFMLSSRRSRMSGFGKPVAPIVLERLDQSFLLVVVLRKGACDSSNSHEHRSRSSTDIKLGIGATYRSEHCQEPANCRLCIVLVDLHAKNLSEPSEDCHRG